MALNARGSRNPAAIWPGFLDVMTALVMVLMFVLTVFMIVQFSLRDTITEKNTELGALNAQLAQLADALGMEKARSADLTGQVATLAGDLDRQTALVASLTASLDQTKGQLGAATARITSFEAQVAALLSERDQARGQVADLTTSRDKLISDQEALNLALAKARTEVDANAEAARLAAARREALEALVADLRQRADETGAKLDEAEAARLTEAAAASALRERLKASGDELTAMTLALEDQRRKAEETLTLLAAAQAARDAALADQAGNLTEAQKRAGLLATAEKALASEKTISAEGQRKVVLLNEQVTALRGQLQSLQSLLDASAARDSEAKIQIEALGTQLNSALAQVAAEQKRRAELEAAERQRAEAEAERLAAENTDLARYRSEFFGRLSEVLAGREGVRVVGDRFVFSSEVLFAPGSAELLPEGRAQIAGVVRILDQVAAQIPPEIDWIIRVDGHTDNTPLSGQGEFKDNWQLSQARALSVVRFMQDDLGFPPERMAATGFGEYRPVAPGNSPEARAQNRRIELKLTER